MTAATNAPSRRGLWIDHWQPDNEAFWEETGERIARKNLALSMFAEHIGLCVWVLWTIVVLNLADHIVCASATWFVYLRTSVAVNRMPSLAEAAV